MKHFWPATLFDSVRFAQLEIRGSGIYAPGQIHGTVEIDWIALVQ